MAERPLKQPGYLADSLDPVFALAAFKLGRAHEITGDTKAAKRAYEHALATLDSEGRRHDQLLEQVDLDAVAVACTQRIRALRTAARG